MKLKLDENMPGVASTVLAAHGHGVVTVAEKSLAGAPDSIVARAAATEGRMLVTMDRGFADIRSYPPGQHPGVLLLRLTEQRPSAVAATLTAVAQSYQLDDLVGCIIIAQPNGVRVRRAPTEP
jgi:predicted nuclease of predicted toxin-antitoxin system